MIYIHAGFGKCASTTIQRFLWDNAEFLRAHGRIYPDPATPEHRIAHHALAGELKRGPDEAWQTLRAAMDRREPGQHIVLSSENFNGSDPEALHAAFANEPIRLIFYLKDLPRFMVSRYAHATKVGINTLDFDAFFQLTFGSDKTDFPRRLVKWCDVFGAQNITVRALDPRVLVMGDVGPDVLDAVGIAAADIKTGTLEASQPRNVAPGWKTLEMFRALPRSGFRAPPMTFWESVKYVERPPGFDERGQYLTQEQFDRAADLFDSYVDAMNTMGMDARLAYTPRADFVARSFLPSVEHVPAAQQVAYLNQLTSSVLFTRAEKKKDKSRRRQRDN